MESLPIVLIADDDANIRLLVHVTLDSERYRIVEAPDGDRAWLAIEQCRPALVLLDVNMPGRDGVELTRAIKRSPVLAHTYVILLTAETSPQARAEGEAAGADQYLTKPFSPLHLLQLVEQVLP
jgi:two-component system phosphate regulon response regulator PhoB